MIMAELCYDFLISVGVISSEVVGIIRLSSL